MQRAAALQRIEAMRFNVGPESHRPVAIGNAIHGHTAVRPRRVEAARAATTHGGGKGARENPTEHHGRKLRSGRVRKEVTVNAILPDPLNFHFHLARNNNSLIVFMIRLRRVYRAWTINGSEHSALGIGSLGSQSSRRCAVNQAAGTLPGHREQAASAY